MYLVMGCPMISSNTQVTGDYLSLEAIPNLQAFGSKLCRTTFWFHKLSHVARLPNKTNLVVGSLG